MTKPRYWQCPSCLEPLIRGSSGCDLPGCPPIPDWWRRSPKAVLQDWWIKERKAASED